MENPKKTDEIVIRISGPKKLRQEIADRVHEVVLDEAFKFAKPGCELKITSTIEPSDEVMG